MSTTKAQAKEKQNIPTMYWMFAGLVGILFVGVVLKVLNSTMMLVVFVVGVLSILLIEEGRKKIPNALIWRHPDNGGGYDLTVRDHLKDQRPHPFPYAWWKLKKVNVYFWYEKKVETEQTKEDVRPLSTEVVPNTCVCGYHPEGKMSDRLFSAHVLWNPKKTSTSEDDFNRQHHQITAADIKSAAVAVATAVQDRPITKAEYLIEPYEPEPDLSKSPNELWDETNWTQDLHDFYGDDDSLMEKVKVGTAVVMCLILAVLIFLIVGAKGS